MTTGHHDDSLQGAARIPEAVRTGEATVWFNPSAKPAAAALPTLLLTGADVEVAAARWRRFAPLLKRLFAELPDGTIGSALTRLSPSLSDRVSGGRGAAVWVKADHALPVTGCIKARGGIYEVLVHAEALALRLGLLGEGQSTDRLADDAVRAAFAAHTVAVGSTGNLGFSVGLMARALGFAVEVHMSHDAKEWKKARLRALGARVVEHAGDYATAVSAARASFRGDAGAHFVDDEDSTDLFLGYATAAAELQRQLAAAGVVVDAAHPLVVTLPCGVGGAPGGVTFGLKLLFGDHVRCVFVEPVRSPCMLVQLAAGLDAPISVYDVGLDNRTAADGLAVPRASMLVARTVGAMIEAVVTVADDHLTRWLKVAWTEAGMRLEPSAAASFAALAPFLAVADRSELEGATHVLWTTGGALLPDDEFEAALRGGDGLDPNRSRLAVVTDRV